jgi:uncharacterized protein (TIGR03437 family)
MNSAAQIPSTLPGGRLAPGAFFTIGGVNLADGRQQPEVLVETGGQRLKATVISAVPERVEAWLPTEAPVGPGSIRVVRAGVSSESVSVDVAAAQPGLYSRNGTGWGPATAERVAGNRQMQLDFWHAAAPGDEVVLAGTGLGRRGAVEAFVAGLPAQVQRVERGQRKTKSGPPGMDRVTIRVPKESPLGCSVPAYLRQGAALSNTVTVPIAVASGEECRPVEYLPIARDGNISLIVVSRTTARLKPNRNEVAAVFVRLDSGAQAEGITAILPPVGTCTQAAMSAELALPDSLAIGLAASVPGERLRAGPNVSLIHNDRRYLVPRVPGGDGLYSREFLQTGAQAGNSPFVSEETILAGGGQDVGRFAVAVPTPETFEWTNGDSLDTIDIHKGFSVKWDGVAPDRLILVYASASPKETPIASSVICVEHARTGGVTIAPDMLSHFPAEENAAGSLVLVSIGDKPLEFAADGLVRGLAVTAFVHARDSGFSTAH